MIAVLAPPPFRFRPAPALAIGLLVAACGGGDLALPNGESVIAIEVVEGDGQRGSVGQPLAAPVVVEVTDDDGKPVEGATVQFTLISAGEGAGITPGSARTNAEGRVEAQVLLGDKVGVQTGAATVAGDGDSLPTATFSALAQSPDNRAPISDFGWRCDGLTCRFTDSSTDSDGSVTAWAWRFGDGGTSAEQEPTHTYAGSGTYTVQLTVTDDEGGTGQLSDDVTVTAPSEPPSNQPPRAGFDVSCANLRCSFTDRSEDEDGSIESRQWEFGDGATSSDRNPSHTYASGGQFQVILTVVDDDGAEDTRTGTAEPESPAPPPPPPPPPAQNSPPDAEFEVACQELRCTFEDRSSDEDGTIEARQWDFGDGTTSSGRNPSHTYASAGQYEVVLTVTDDDGAEDTRIRIANPEAPAPPPPPPPDPNDPPEADFEVDCQELGCTFVDRSSDRDGSIVSWEWDFGDGTTSTEQNPSHTYDSPGRYTVLLLVTDDDGAADTRTGTAEPVGPPPEPEPEPEPEPNREPDANFDARCENLTCAFTDKSKDDDGVIVSWSWTFGDGATSNEQNPVHTYAEPGRYVAVLTVTDNDGATGSKDRQVDAKD